MVKKKKIIVALENFLKVILKTENSSKITIRKRKTINFPYLFLSWSWGQNRNEEKNRKWF